MKNNIMLITILTIFLAIGFIAPFVRESFNANVATVNTNGVITSAESGDVTATDVFLSLTTVFFWTFGNVPAWLDTLILIPLRVIFYVVLYDKIKGIGS